LKPCSFLFLHWQLQVREENPLKQGLKL